MVVFTYLEYNCNRDGVAYFPRIPASRPADCVRGKYVMPIYIFHRMNRKERRKELTPTRIHAKFLYSEKEQLPVRYEEKEDGRVTAYVTVEGYASTKVKDGSGDIVEPEGIDLSRFEAWNAPLKAMHGRGVLSNVWVILSAKIDTMWLYIKAEARLDISKDNNWRPINEQDYNLYDRLMNRTINGFSVGFHNIKEWWDADKKANIIHSMTLHEVSLVDVPDNPLTIVKMLQLHHDLSSDNSMKKTLADFIVKALEVSSVKVGEMYRIKGAYEEWSWSYVYNCELIKMSTTEEWASEENPMCYFLVYSMDIDGFKPSTSVVKSLLSEVQVVEISAEQLKELQDEETKELSDEEESEDLQEVTEGEEEGKELDTEPQESEAVWNDGDAPEQGDADEGEKILAGTNDLETQDKAIGDLQNKVKELEDQNAEIQQQNEELQADLEEAQKAFFEVFEDNKTLRAKINKVLAIKSVKVEHGLKQIEDKEEKKGNLAIAMEEAAKLL